MFVSFIKFVPTINIEMAKDMNIAKIKNKLNERKINVKIDNHIIVIDGVTRRISDIKKVRPQKFEIKFDGKHPNYPKNRPESKNINYYLLFFIPISLLISHLLFGSFIADAIVVALAVWIWLGYYYDMINSYERNNKAWEDSMSWYKK